MRVLSHRDFSLRYVLLLALMLGLLVPSWIAFEFEKADEQQRLYKALIEDRDRYADLLAVSLREPMWQLAAPFAEPLIDKIMEDPKVSHIVVHRLPDGQIFVERGSEGVAGVDVARREIVLQNKVLGMVSLTVNDSEVARATLKAQQRFLWRTAAVGAAAMLLIYLALNLRLNRPIDRLVLQSEALARGNLTDAVEWHRDDELGRLGRSLENTRKALAALIGELKSVNTDLRSENAQRRNAETQLARHAEELEARVRERTRELSDANAHLSVTLNDLRQTQTDLIESKKLASLGRMVAGLAHELNTPIGNALTIGTTIGERIAALRREVDGGPLRKSALTEFLANTTEASDVLERSLTRAATLVNRFKKVAENESIEQISTFELAPLVSGLRDMFQSTNHHAAVTVDLQIPTGVFLTSYGDLLVQVLRNLLDNAVQHGFGGRPGGHIVVSAIEQSRQVEIVVQDNGCGIPANVQDHIFEPLFTTRMGGGSVGLGLSVAQNLVVRNLGGRLTLRAAATPGACFVVTIPLVSPAQTGHTS